MGQPKSRGANLDPPPPVSLSKGLMGDLQVDVSLSGSSHSLCQVDVSLTRVRVKDAGNPEEPAAARFVETDSSTLVSTMYLRYLRQQLSRSARFEGGAVLDWAASEGYESAFGAFEGPQLDDAARGLFSTVCPSDPSAYLWAPRASDVPPRFVHATYAVLFLVVQQFAENLRQSGHFKKRTWQYLACALPSAFDFDPRVPDWNALCWGDFRSRCEEVQLPPLPFPSFFLKRLSLCTRVSVVPLAL